MSARVRLGLLQILAPLIAILAGALIAAGIILALGQNPLEVYAIMVRFSLARLDSLAAICFKATPLLFSGLAVALSFRASVWNIGVEGQYYVGAFAAAWVGFSIGGLPAGVHLPLAVLAGAAGGALWAFVPIALKLRRGAHEVITTIMMNYIAGALVLYLLADVFRDPTQAGTPRVRTPLLPDSARMPLLGPLLQRIGLEIPEHSALNWFLVVGVVMCAGAAYVLARSRFGYEVRAVASNPAAAEAAGISLDRVRFVMFMAAGAVAGLVGLSDILGFFGYFDIDFPKGLGFAGISVALLARNHPLGIIPAALLFGFLDRGAQGVQVFAGVPREVITILQAVIILAIVVAYELLTRYVRVHRKREAERALGGSPIAAVAEGS
ncbi:MAG: ABC transporter permease [Armatimonadota bacterium]|nr:ABC transporter permease [Armatimonadota bacterium]